MSALPPEHLDLGGHDRDSDPRPGAPRPLVAEPVWAQHEALCWAGYAATMTMAAEAEMDPQEAARMATEARDAWALAGEWSCG